MRKISANYIFPISSAPVEKGIILLENNGVIADVINPGSYDGSIEEVEHFNGIICPGFVNTHCHLELSHMKGVIPEKTGLPDFLKQVVTSRQAGFEDIQHAVDEAEKEMLRNGIVAVGDISNDSTSFYQKSLGNLKYHTFLEVLGFYPNLAEVAYEKALDLMKEYKKHFRSPDSGQHISITPHAPYSTSTALLKMVSDNCYTDDKGIMTIHNQESEEENKMFLNKKSRILEVFEALELDTEWWEAPGFRSLQSTLVHISKCNRMLLVHNTYTNREDIRWAHTYAPQVWWCFCPNANLYIEDRLPDIYLFREENARITIGTDSLASNSQLSILEEIKTISRYNPDIPAEELIGWATLNGAEFLGFHRELGSLEKGKRPGLNLIRGVSGERFRMSEVEGVDVIG